VVEALEEQRERAKTVEVVHTLAARTGTGKRRNVKTRTAPSQHIRLSDGSLASTDPLAPENVWQAIRTTVDRKYSFQFEAYTPFTAKQKLAMLRGICQKFGIQVVTRDYDLKVTSTNQSPFTPEDILRLFPVPQFTIAGVGSESITQLEKGKVLLARGEIGLAFQYLSHAMALLTQVFGPMHSLVAQCYHHLALVCYHAADFAKAVDHQECALIISQRVIGLDHHDTASAHSNLALFLHAAGHFDQALLHIRRAIFLYELISGTDHPETASAHLNLAMIYQDTDRIHEGMAHLQEALRISKSALGDKHLHVALCEHAIAVAYGFLGAFRNAIAHERRAKQLYSDLLGPESSRVKQSLYWLNRFATRLVAETKGETLPTPGSQKVNELSPLSWTSLDNKKLATPFKGRVTMKDLFRIIDQKQRAAKGATPAPAPTPQAQDETVVAEPQKLSKKARKRARMNAKKAASAKKAEERKNAEDQMRSQLQAQQTARQALTSKTN
jgi:tetratricopeptide (TPR) repeat protein